MNLTEIYNRISRKTDTKGTQINVAETKRVIAAMFDELSRMPAEEAFSFVGKGIAKAKNRKKKK